MADYHELRERISAYIHNDEDCSGAVALQEQIDEAYENGEISGSSYDNLTSLLFDYID